jgi:hypothetical protein
LIDANILIYKNMSGTLKFTAGEIKYPAPHLQYAPDPLSGNSRETRERLRAADRDPSSIENVRCQM